MITHNHTTDRVQISVIIPTYQRPGLLLRCLDALFRQSMDHRTYELIVVTDGPDPVTVEAVEVWLAQESLSRQDDVPALSILQMNRKGGPAAARNLGWLRARAELIAFTDDDTVPDAAWLRSWCDAAAELDEAATSGYLALTGRTIVPLGPEPTDYELNTFGLESGEFITANCCCSKAALQLVDGFDDRFSTAWREDSDLHFRFLQQQIAVHRVPGAIVVHPVRPAPWGVSLREQRKGMFNALLYKKHPVLYRSRIQSSPLWNYYAMILLLPAGLLLLLTGLDVPGLVALAGWGFLFLQFVWRRLRNSSRKPGHVMEMAVTSALIPFLSVYWQFYGSLKFRTLVL